MISDKCRMGKDNETCIEYEIEPILKKYVGEKSPSKEG
jgi:hypothetical protein